MADIRSWDEVEGHYRGYSGRTFISKTTLTRPADTTQYAAGDQVADSTSAPTALNFGTCAVYNGGGGLLIDAVCKSNANQATKPNLRLYLYNGSPTLNNDNANWNPSHADIGNIVAMAEFASWEVGGTAAGTAGNVFSLAQINKGYRCASGQVNLWGCFVERGTYTPVSAEQLTISLKVAHD